MIFGKEPESIFQKKEFLLRKNVAKKNIIIF